jgi:hypothetical protein
LQNGRSDTRFLGLVEAVFDEVGERWIDYALDLDDVDGRRTILLGEQGPGGQQDGPESHAADAQQAGRHKDAGAGALHLASIVPRFRSLAAGGGCGGRAFGL